MAELIKKSFSDEFKSEDDAEEGLVEKDLEDDDLEDDDELLKVDDSEDDSFDNNDN